MKLKLFSAIFPDGYYNPPTEAEVRAEVKRKITSSTNIPQELVEWLEQIECPYMREAYASVLNEVCAKMEERCLRKVGCVCDGCYKPYWDKREIVIKDMLDEAREQQMELEKTDAPERANETASPTKTAQAPAEAAPQPAPTTIINIAAGAAYYDIHSCTNLNIR